MFRVDGYGALTVCLTVADQMLPICFAGHSLGASQNRFH